MRRGIFIILVLTAVQAPLAFGEKESSQGESLEPVSALAANAAVEKGNLPEEVMEDLGHSAAEAMDVPSIAKAEPEKAMTEPLVDEDKPWAFPPVVNISKWGNEIKIIVEPNVLMDREKIKEINYIRLETTDGSFLGLKTYGENETTRRAEFMMDPEQIQIDEVKVIANSKLEGDWSGILPLKESSGEFISAYSWTAEELEKEASESEESEGAGSEEEKVEAGLKPSTQKPTEETKAAKKKGWLW